MFNYKSTDLIKMDESEIEDAGYDAGLSCKQSEYLAHLMVKYNAVLRARNNGKYLSCPGAEELVAKIDAGITIDDLKKELSA